MIVLSNAYRQMEQAEEKARKADIVRKLDYYMFNMVDLRKDLEEYIKIKEHDIPFSLTQIVKKAINNKSLVYKNPPERIFPDNDTFDYAKIAPRKNTTMKVLERRTNLLGRPAIQIHWDVDHFEYIIHQYYTILEMDNYKVKKFAYEIENYGNSERLFMYWSETENYVANAAGSKLKDQGAYGVNDEMVNPYGVLPFVFTYPEEPVGTFYVSGADDLIDANHKVNFLLTLLNYLARSTTFKQAFVRGANLEAQKLEFGYNKILTLEGEGEIGLLDLTVSLTENIENIKFQIELVLSNNDLNADFAGEGSASSGFQLIVENIPLLSLWEDSVDVWREHERSIYEVERVVYNTNTNGNLPDKMSVDFAEVKFPVAPAELREQDGWELEKGLTSLIRIKQRENPDANPEDIKAELLAIQEENAMFKTVKVEEPIGLEGRLRI
jgi:hypothetical protein